VGGHADERSPRAAERHAHTGARDSIVAAHPRHACAPKGTGYSPVNLGHDESAWKKNPRVELLIIMTAIGATGVALQCDNAVARGVTAALSHKLLEIEVWLPIRSPNVRSDGGSAARARPRTASMSLRRRAMNVAAR
jgi:hypothetical protein